jgi:hypothetical protein
MAAVLQNLLSTPVLFKTTVSIPWMFFALSQCAVSVEESITLRFFMLVCVLRFTALSVLKRPALVWTWFFEASN